MCTVDWSDLLSNELPQIADTFQKIQDTGRPQCIENLIAAFLAGYDADLLKFTQMPRHGGNIRVYFPGQFIHAFFSSGQILDQQDACRVRKGLEKIGTIAQMIGIFFQDASPSQAFAYLHNNANTWAFQRLNSANILACRQCRA
jgi:hypothetical protein